MRGEVGGGWGWWGVGRGGEVGGGWGGEEGGSSERELTPLNPLRGEVSGSSSPLNSGVWRVNPTELCGSTPRNSAFLTAHTLCPSPFPRPPSHPPGTAFANAHHEQGESTGLIYQRQGVVGDSVSRSRKDGFFFFTDLPVELAS